MTIPDNNIYFSPVVEDNNKGLRLDKFLAASFPEFSRSQLQRLILEGNVSNDDVVIADAGAPFGADTAVDDHMLAEGVVVADVAIGGFAVPAEYLGIGADDGALVNTVVLTHACAGNHRCIRHDLASVAYLHIFVDKGEGVNCNVVAELGRRINMC